MIVADASIPNRRQGGWDVNAGWAAANTSMGRANTSIRAAARPVLAFCPASRGLKGGQSAMMGRYTGPRKARVGARRGYMGNLDF